MTAAPEVDAYDGARADAAMPTESMADDAAPPAAVVEAPKKNPNYTAVFAAELIELARADRRIVGITAGMPTGTGMSKFQAAFPDRMFDVGIAEQHSVAMATGLAMGGMRPVVALYSTFLQRAFDQTVHDVCQNDQPVLIAVDRAGLVGEDGTSHQGMFTLPAQRQLPNLVIASPKDEQELRSLLHTALSQDHPFALHYPRDAGFGLPPVVPEIIPVGRGEVLREGRDLLFVGFGPIVARAIAAADLLAAEGWSIGVINARYARPLDRQLILDQARGKRLLVTFEESVVAGGFGSGVLELVEEVRLADPAYRDVAVRILGIPGERFVDHGSVADLRRVLRLDAEGLAAQVREALAALRATPGRSESEVAGGVGLAPAPRGASERDCRSRIWRSHWFLAPQVACVTVSRAYTARSPISSSHAPFCDLESRPLPAGVRPSETPRGGGRGIDLRVSPWIRIQTIPGPGHGATDVVSAGKTSLVRAGYAAASVDSYRRAISRMVAVERRTSSLDTTIALRSGVFIYETSTRGHRLSRYPSGSAVRVDEVPTGPRPRRRPDSSDP